MLILFIIWNEESDEDEYGEVDIDNMTFEEYERYELAMSKRKNKVDIDNINIEEIGSAYLKRMEQEEVQNGCDDEEAGDTAKRMVICLTFPFFLQLVYLLVMLERREKRIDIASAHGQVKTTYTVCKYDVARIPSGLKDLFHTPNATVIPTKDNMEYRLDVASKNFKFGVVDCYSNGDDELQVLDVAR
ncbi:hypothetical protein Tco_0212985 [Tanacetum coccineum]